MDLAARTNSRGELPGPGFNVRAPRLAGVVEKRQNILIWQSGTLARSEFDFPIVLRIARSLSLPQQASSETARNECRE